MSWYKNLKNFTVSEKQQAEVPYILISNKNDFPVFILDGTLLDGWQKPYYRYEFNDTGEC